MQTYQGAHLTNVPRRSHHGHHKATAQQRPTCRFPREQGQLGADSDFTPPQTHNSELRLEDSRKVVADMRVPHTPHSPSCCPSHFCLPTRQQEAEGRERGTHRCTPHGARGPRTRPHPTCHRSLGSVWKPLATAGRTCRPLWHALGPELASPGTGSTLGR